MLAALRGHQVEVRASGSQAQEAVEHVLALARRRFDESVEEPARRVAAAVAGTPRRSRRGREADRCLLLRESRSGRRAG